MIQKITDSVVCSWTGVKVKSQTQSDIILRYNLQFHNLLNNRVVKFFTPTKRIKEININLCPTLLFIGFDIMDSIEIDSMYRGWSKVDLCIKSPIRVKDQKGNWKLMVIPNSEMNKFIDTIELKYIVNLISDEFCAEDTIEIISGSFKGFNGKVLEVTKDKVLITAKPFNMTVNLWLNKNEIEKSA